MKSDYKIYPSGETAITIAFEAIIDETINEQVIALYQHICNIKIDGVKDIVPSYHTLTLVYDLPKENKQHFFVFDAMKTLLENAVNTCSFVKKVAKKPIEIPVCYHPSLGLDIEELAVEKNISIEEIAAIHSRNIYRVYSVGFLPGFAYMGKLNEQLNKPRKASPRQNVAGGSVGIAGEQTGIYPLVSPGGWNIIGQTPLQLFDTEKEEIVFFKTGDNVQFKPINLNEFNTLKSKQISIRKDDAIEGEGLRILKQGVADSVQDLGRYGHQHQGINPSGAMDRVAAQIANILVGNSINEAVVELHFPASTFQFQTDILIALSGADFGASINGKTIPINKPIIVAKHSMLQFSKPIDGARCYLAVKDGFKIKSWLNSYSTNLKANAGGYFGRLLKKGDVLVCNKTNDYASLLQHKNFIALPWRADVKDFYNNDHVIRCIVGNEFQLLTDSSKKELLSALFTITAQSDRMGYRLHDKQLIPNKNISLISTAVTKGTVQLLPNGQLIILMTDHQTMGGYPRVAHVTSEDLPKLAQTGAGHKISFSFISQQEAENLAYNRSRYLLQLQNACIFNLKEYLLKHDVN